MLFSMTVLRIDSQPNWRSSPGAPGPSPAGVGFRDPEALPSAVPPRVLGGDVPRHGDTSQPEALWGDPLRGGRDSGKARLLKNTYISRTTVSQDVQTRFPVQLAFAKFLPKIKGNF